LHNRKKKFTSAPLFLDFFALLIPGDFVPFATFLVANADDSIEVAQSEILSVVGPATTQNFRTHGFFVHCLLLRGPQTWNQEQVVELMGRDKEREKKKQCEWQAHQNLMLCNWRVAE
jgi:hypothetical protein